MKKSFKSPQNIFISNISEDVWAFISEISDLTLKKKEIYENAALADRDLFAHSDKDNTLIITPKPIDPDFFDYFKSLFPGKNIQVVSPETHSGELCLDILKDKKLYRQLVDIVTNTKKPTLSSYSSSENFYQLYTQLHSVNKNLSLPSAPREVDMWTVNFFGSKSGIRQLAQITDNKPEFKMAKGFVAVDTFNAAKLAANINLEKQAVVIKTNKGHAGMGLLIYKKGELPHDYYKCEDYLLKLLHTDSYWAEYPIIIEDFVEPYSKIGGGNPNAEFHINRNGEVKHLFFGGMRVTKEGVFNGMEIHDSSLPEAISAKVKDIGFFIGEQLASFGYRGYFDVDFVIDKHKNLYVTESNIRRTGCTHIYHAAHALFGRDFFHEAYSLSNNVYDLPKGKHFTLKQLISTLDSILYDPKKKEGLIIASVGLLSKDSFGYMVFGRNKKSALAIEKQMVSLLKK